LYWVTSDVRALRHTSATAALKASVASLCLDIDAAPVGALPLVVIVWLAASLPGNATYLAVV